LRLDLLQLLTCGKEGEAKNAIEPCKDSFLNGGCFQLNFVLLTVTVTHFYSDDRIGNENEWNDGCEISSRTSWMGICIDMISDG